MKRKYVKRILSAALSVLILVSLLVVPASAASYKSVYDKLVNFAKSGTYYGGENDILEGERFWYAEFDIPTTEYTWLRTYTFQVCFTNLNRLELRLGSNQYSTWVIVPKEPGQPWEIKDMEYTVFRGSVLIDPASFTRDTELTVYSFTGDESFLQNLLWDIRFYFPAILDFTSQVLADQGCDLTDLGFAQLPANDVHLWHQFAGSASCTNGGEGDFVCRYCNAMTHMTLPAGGEHDWSNSVLSEPTCTQTGLRIFLCDRCNASYAEPIPALGHDWNEGNIVVEPGCETEGVKLCTCSRCMETMDVPIPALGHLWTFTELLTEAEEGGPHACTGLYTCSRCSETKEDKLCAGEVFKDMPPEGFWSHDPIDWAWLNGITGGTGPDTFSPDLTVTRSQVVTFLWAAAEKPVPETTEIPFTDVKEGDWFLSPVLWAVENGITGGIGNNQFGPGAVCSRAQIVTFLWAAAGKPEPEMTESPFTDVKEGDWYLSPVLWAVENGVTGGVGNNQFGPGMVCTRAQAVTFLYKASQIPATEAPAEP